jgi:alpha-L-fucosidase
LLYVICLGWPGEEVTVDLLGTWDKKLYEGEIKSISMLGSDEEIQWSHHKKSLTMKTPKEKSCEHAFVFKTTRNFKVN